MPKYDDVPKGEQLPAAKTSAPAAAPPNPWVAITTTVPSSVRRQMSVACAVHDIKLKDAVTEALQAWLADHPARVD